MRLLRNVIITKNRIDDDGIIDGDVDVSSEFNTFENDAANDGANYCCNDQNDIARSNSDKTDNNGGSNKNNYDNIENKQKPIISSRMHYGLTYDLINTIFKELYPLKSELFLKLICDAISCAISLEVTDILNIEKDQSKSEDFSLESSILNDDLCNNEEGVEDNDEINKTEDYHDNKFNKNKYEQQDNPNNEISSNLLEPLIKILIEASQTVGISISSILDITISCTDNIHPQNSVEVSKITPENPPNFLLGISDPFSFESTVINACFNINSGLLASAVVLFTIKSDFYSQEIADWLVNRYGYFLYIYLICQFAVFV
jgi:hypothetical protein